MTIKACLFDVFGTVVDWRGSITREMQTFAREKDITADWEQFALDWRSLYQPAMEKVREGNRGYVRLDTLHKENLMQLLSDYHLDNLDEQEIDHVNKVWHRLSTWEDSLPGMNRMQQKYILASLSNGNIALMVNLARFNGLTWDAILGAEPTQGYKPQPDVYLKSVEMLGLEPADCLMVAAHNYDLQAAQALGLRTAYVNRPYEYGAAQTMDKQADGNWDFITESMTELAQLLDC